MQQVRSYSAGAGGWAVLVHGGAGEPPADPAAAAAGCRAAAQAAAELLGQGCSALDAVQRAVELLESDPRFNAGTGGSLTEDGELELDASIMDGAGLRFGAVCSLPPFEHPVAIARAVLEDGRHCLYASEGAAAFARARGFVPADPASMITEGARRKLARVLESGTHRAQPTGTVGAVAVSSEGVLAAATSTGGTTAKRHGRVGDSPIPGGGTYATDIGAASATGHGEGILRVGLTRDIVDRLRAGEPADEAAAAAIAAMQAKVGSLGGVIVATADGRLAWARSTQAMSWAAIWHTGQVESGT